ARDPRAGRHLRGADGRRWLGTDGGRAELQVPDARHLRGLALRAARAVGRDDLPVQHRAHHREREARGRGAGMALTILCVTFLLFLVTGVPVAFAIGLSAVCTILYEGLPFIVIFQRMMSGMNVFSFLAIP